MYSTSDELQPAQRSDQSGSKRPVTVQGLQQDILTGKSQVHAGALSHCHVLLGNLNSTETLLQVTTAFPMMSQNVCCEKGLRE